MTLEEAKSLIGETVAYRGGGSVEVGIITSVNDQYVFVNYDGNNSKATRPQDLIALNVMEDGLEID